MPALFKRKSVKIIALCLATVIFIALVLEIGILLRSQYEVYFPDYEKTDISGILKKEELSDSDYEILFMQTGLTRLGIDGLRDRGLEKRIIRIQDQYFEKQNYYLNSFAPFTGYLSRNTRPEVAEFALLENGDILYSPTTYFSFVRLGHTSLVVDASRGYMAQASGFGSPVKYVQIDHFFSRPAFAILRVNTEVGQAVTDYTKGELIGVRYSLLAGFFGDKAPKELNSTHCSHFIWYAYMQSGVDLDSSGGKIVTPDNIFYSEAVSVVQIYGINPEKVFK